MEIPLNSDGLNGLNEINLSENYRKWVWDDGKKIVIISF